MQQILNKNRIVDWSKMAYWVLMGGIVFSCAKPLSPTGGPRDEIAPEVVKSSPATRTLNYEGDQVRFWFDEPIRKPTFDKEIFVSPFIRRPKIVLADNSKKFTIKFEDDLLPNTTYVITLTEVKDITESNPIEDAYTLAFSTGDQLDSMELKGKIQSARLDKGVKDMIVMLFDADSAVNGTFFGQRPSYLTKSDEDGAFSFQYLRNAPFRILAVKDGDQSNSYSIPSEVVAIAPDSLISFPDDSTNLATVTLYAFLPDEVEPRLQDYDWINDSTLAIRFSENLRLDTMKIVLTDTLDQDSVRITDFSWYKHKDPEVLIHMPRPQELYSDLHISGMSDSLWNLADTVVRIVPTRNRTETKPLLQDPTLDMEAEAWTFLSYRKLTEADKALITLSDTVSADSSRTVFSYTWEQKGMDVWLKPVPVPDSVMPMILRVSGELLQTDEQDLLDSTFMYNLNWFDPEEFGEIRGVVHLDSTWEGQGPIILRLMSGESIVETAFDTTFYFRLLKPGDYSFHIVLDADSNQVWSPGVIFPPRLPEKIYEHREPISIKANWEFEEHVIEMDLSPPPVEVAETEGEEGELEEGGPRPDRGRRPRPDERN